MRREEIADRLVREFFAVHCRGQRGLQVKRKDKDLMQDTGGVSKGRDREPNQKPPRDDVKNRFRDKRLQPSEKDEDTSDEKAKDREVKKPVRRHARLRMAFWRKWTPGLVQAYMEREELQPCTQPSDLQLGQVILARNRGKPPVTCHYRRISGDAQYLWATEDEVARRLNDERIPVPGQLVMAVSGHPLDEMKKSDFGIFVEVGNYHQDVRNNLHGILERTRRVSEKDFSGQDEIMAEADRIVRSEKAAEIIARFRHQGKRPSFCAECVYDQAGSGE